MDTPSSLIDNRTIRVFISSTFSDMNDERTELMKKTFPRLRVMAAKRDVTLTEVDLRWGITKEESESGKVVDICLREIQNSIPFFIGIKKGARTLRQRGLRTGDEDVASDGGCRGGVSGRVCEGL